MPPKLGQILEGKYEVGRLLARGGVGAVYLGRNLRIGKPVAIKVLDAALANDPTVVDRFEQEARVAARIRSAHVADTYDLGELPTGERFIVMELLEGETLGARIERDGQIDERALAGFALEILEALATAHDAGIVHRDLKPENVFLTERDGRDFVKVVDFGISKVLERDAKHALTVTGTVLGTPLYMSPEQARGQVVDARTDLYALGVILYEAALGEPPFDGNNLNELLFRVALDPAPPLERRLPSVSATLAAIVRRAMEKAPDARFQTAAEMRDAVLAWQAEVGILPRSSTPSLDEIRRSLSLPPPDVDDDDDELALAGIVPRRSATRRFVGLAMLVAIAALGATHPREVREMSNEVVERAGPLWREAEAKAAAAITPPAPAPAPTVKRVGAPALTVITVDLPPCRSGPCQK